MSAQLAPVDGEIVNPPAVRQPRQIRVVEDTGPLANLLDTSRFEHLQRIANVMANSSLLPDHLRFTGLKNNQQMLPPEVIAANCFRVTNQALRWGMDPFSIIDETYVVGGKLGYGGKLVIAVINSRAKLKTRLRYDFDGQGDNLTITVSGTFEGETEVRTVKLRVGDAKTDNQMWRKDPEQKLVYSGATKWGRRHCPEVLAGVLIDDDLERMAAQPVGSLGAGENLNDRVKLLRHEQEEKTANTVGPSASTTADTKPAHAGDISKIEPETKLETPKQADAPTLEMPSYTAFVEAVDLWGSENGKSSDDVVELLKKLPVAGHDIKTGRSTGPGIRGRVYAAITAGKMDWSTGKITD